MFRLSVLHAGLPVRRPEVPQPEGYRSKVRHVFGPAFSRGGSCLRSVVSSEGISIRIVDCEQVIEDSEADRFLPAAREPHITLPTTTYRTKRVFPRNLLPADYYYSLAPLALIIMLVLTQLSVGAFLSASTGRFLDETMIAAMRPLHSLARVFGLSRGFSTSHWGVHSTYRAHRRSAYSWLSQRSSRLESSRSWLSLPAEAGSSK